MPCNCLQWKDNYSVFKNCLSLWLGVSYCVYVSCFICRTALHLACAQGKEDIVKFLLANNAKSNLCDNLGRTPLMKVLLPLQCDHNDYFNVKEKTLVFISCITKRLVQVPNVQSEVIWCHSLTFSIHTSKRLSFRSLLYKKSHQVFPID